MHHAPVSAWGFVSSTTDLLYVAVPAGCCVAAPLFPLLIVVGSSLIFDISSQRRFFESSQRLVVDCWWVLQQDSLFLVAPFVVVQLASFEARVLSFPSFSYYGGVVSPWGQPSAPCFLGWVLSSLSLISLPPSPP